MLFQDRREAGEKLAQSLEQYIITEEKEELQDIKDSLLVLAIPRGGIILADVIASYLQCKLDIIVSRKIGAEFNKEAAIGAVMPDGRYFLNQHAIDILNVSKAYIEKEVEEQRREIERRLLEFRGTANYRDKLKDKVVVLVDDGIATGATISATLQWIRQNHKCKKLIIAAPVAPANNQTVVSLNQIADKVIILHTPIEFYAVGQFYKEFEQTTDKEVKDIMKRYGYTIE